MSRSSDSPAADENVEYFPIDVKPSRTGQFHPRLEKWPKSDVWQEARLWDDATREMRDHVPIPVRGLLNTPPVGRELIRSERV